MPIWLKKTPTGIVLHLHCQPGAKLTKVVGLHDGCLKISLQAPALENRANEMLLSWLWRIFLIDFFNLFEWADRA